MPATSWVRSGAVLVESSRQRYSRYATTMRNVSSVGSALTAWGDEMPFPRNQAYAQRQPARLKPGERYCGECGEIVTGLLTLNANNKVVGECCTTSHFKPMYRTKKQVADASEA